MNKIQGVTLVELMIVLLLVAILGTIAVPGFNSFIINNRHSTQFNDFVAALNYARSEAIRTASFVTLCRSANAVTSTTPSCAGSGSWQQGYIAFIDVDGDGVRDAGDTVLLAREPLDGGNTLTGKALPPATTSALQAQVRITFNNRGFANNGMGDFTGYMTLCDSRGAAGAKGLVITAAGRPRRTVDTGDADAIEEPVAGTNLTCP